jgi:hypothetical protein
VKLVVERQPLAQFELDAALGIGGLEADHVPLDGTALGRAATDLYLYIIRDAAQVHAIIKGQ